MSHEAIWQEALRLSPSDRAKLAQDLWDSIADMPEAVELSDEHWAILNERLEAHKNDPAGSSWEEAKARILAKLRER